MGSLTTIFGEYQPLIATMAGILAVFVLILRFRMNAFAALILMSILSAIAAGFDPQTAFDTVTKGMGGTLGFIAVVIGLGALFGAILEGTGSVHQLAERLMAGRSVGAGRWTMGGIGLMASIPVFFDVALIILAPLAFAMASRKNKPAMTFGLPLLAGLAVAHAFIPPTPGPIAVAEILGADLGWMIAFGIVIGLASMAVAGPIFAALLDRAGALPMVESGMMSAEVPPTSDAISSVGAAKTAGLIALPLVLILAGTLGKVYVEGGVLASWLTFIGHPFVALLIACAATYVVFRPRNAAEKDRLSSAMGRALEPAGAVILVTGAGGAFKQVLVDTGAGAQLADAMSALGLAPLMAGFVLALIVRVAQGSATVAMITAAGLTAPLAEAAGLGGAQLALVAIAIAAGASGFSHVNDSGFWLVNRVFGLTESQTLRIWTVSTGIISGVGFLGAIGFMAVLG